MTMRAPKPLIDAEVNLPTKQIYDAGKRYRFTWPGQPPRVVAGDELTAICAGADVAMLGIEETWNAVEPEVPSPNFFSRHGSKGDDR